MVETEIRLEQAGKHHTMDARLYLHLSQLSIHINFMRVIDLSFLFRTANLLCTAASIKPGDRVMAILPTIPEYWLMQAACLRTGTEKRLSR